jgi:hypothetical protein
MAAGPLTAAVRVTIVSAASDAPHCGQKRLFSRMPTPQDRHENIVFVQCSISALSRRSRNQRESRRYFRAAWALPAASKYSIQLVIISSSLLSPQRMASAGSGLAGLFGLLS